MPTKHLNLSRLKEIYNRKNENIIALLSSRHDIYIDDDLCFKMGTGQICMDTRSSMIDYHLTVGNCLGFSPLLPNPQSRSSLLLRDELEDAHQGPQVQERNARLRPHRSHALPWPLQEQGHLPCHGSKRLPQGSLHSHMCRLFHRPHQHVQEALLSDCHAARPLSRQSQGTVLSQHRSHLRD